MPGAERSENERLSPLSPRRVMREAWVIFRRTYNSPVVPFKSIGRHCFVWALRTAWSEARSLARLAETGAAVLASELTAIAERLALLAIPFPTPGMLRRRDELLAREARLRIATTFAQTRPASPFAVVPRSKKQTGQGQACKGQARKGQKNPGQRSQNPPGQPYPGSTGSGPECVPGGSPILPAGAIGRDGCAAGPEPGKTDRYRASPA